jgi:HSP20 family protein
MEVIMRSCNLVNTRGMFDEHFPFFSLPVNRDYAESSFSPVTKIVEEDSYFYISLDIPGVDKEHLKVSIKEDVLNITGERLSKFKNSDGKLDTISNFEKSFSLPKDVDFAEIEVSHENGVLDIILPKVKVEIEEKTIDIKSGTSSFLKKITA